MAPNILLTGGSGYLGGSLQAYLKQHPLPTANKLFALVRTESQASQTLEAYGIEPVFIDLENEQAIHEFLVTKDITVVVFTIDSRHSEVQLRIIRSLAKLGKQTHFIHTSGAKGFSSHSKFPLQPPVADDDERMHELHKEQATKESPIRSLPQVDTAIVDEAESLGVKAYIVAPCIVYGEGTGFGNRISIQTVEVVKAALAVRRVCDPNDSSDAIWPVCHVFDQTTLYVHLLHQILAGVNVGSNQNGYYLASPGSVRWRDLYTAMAEPLYRRGLIDDPSVTWADDKAAGKAQLLVAMGGECTWIPRHARKIGWTSAHEPEHILEAAEAEVELILKTRSQTLRFK